MIKQNIDIKPYLQQIILFIVIFSIVVLRRPDIIFNAQPWAEDGKIWLANIYNNGFWNSLLVPQNGYYQTISKLTYGFALLFDISKVALISNIIAISIRCFLLLFLLSKRFSFIHIKYRVLVAIYLLIMPNLTEGYVNITNIHWYLSLYLLLVLITNETNQIKWKIHDYIILIISALSGPFIIFIAPCLLIKRIYERKGVILAIKKINGFDITMMICLLIQLISIFLFSESTRSSASLGASLPTLINIISFRIFEGSFFPNYLIAGMAYKTQFNTFLFLVIVATILYFFIKSNWRFKIASIFPILLISFALAKPMIHLSQSQWQLLLYPDTAERYFFITNFSFFCFIIYLINKLKNKATLTLMFFIIIISPGLFMGLPISPIGESGYKEDIKKFKSLPKGEKMDIRISPYGWTMTLNKK